MEQTGRERVEQGSFIIVLTDATGHVKYVNSIFTQVTGYTSEEIQGVNLRDLMELSPEQYQAIWEVLTSGRPWEGELSGKKKEGEPYPAFASLLPIKDPEGAISHFLMVKEDLSQRRRQEETIRRLAYYDVITNLPSWKLFKDRLNIVLAHAHRNQEMLAIMFLNLQEFKRTVDTLGHALGDRLLKDVASRLTSSLRESDTVAYPGGDEFTLLLLGIAQVRDAVTVAQRVLKILHPSFRVNGHELQVKANIGIALYPNDGEDAQTLLRNADLALRQATEQGPNTYQFYTPTMNARAFERIALENSLNRALERGEFKIYYQPQVDLHTGQIVGVEALVRWQHPDLGLISPMRFIPLAEETDFIIPLSEWILRTACGQIKAWQEAGFPPLRVTVNLSARHFMHKDLIKMTDKILTETGLDPRYLVLELTESTIMQSAGIAPKTLRKLKERGVLLSIDDFGTGYSSLSYLKRFSIDALKIDQSFVRDLPVDQDDVAITAAIIAIAQTLNLKVIAEGVETQEQLSVLRSYRCDEIQGYYFSRPLSAEAIAQLLQEGRRLTLEEGSSR
ncbi:MAG TPA: EAL domain-containing protein [Candidatus Limnocylindrales bacterium]|nr:EAL domain-containing protein [Candidatus Limnocylindrales bacterium]